MKRIIITLLILGVMTSFQFTHQDHRTYCKSFLITFKENSTNFNLLSKDSTENPEYAAKTLADLMNRSDMDTFILKIRSHCDKREKNKQKICELRLEKFKNLLVKNKLELNRIKGSVVLDNEPIITEAELSEYTSKNGKSYSDSKRAVNRRLDFKIIYKEK